MAESSIDLIHNEKYFTWFSDNYTAIAHMRELVKNYPDEVKVVYDYTKDDYGMAVRLPKSWYREPKPPRTRNLTDEQREEMSERLKKARAKKGEKQVNGND